MDLVHLARLIALWDEEDIRDRKEKPKDYRSVWKPPARPHSVTPRLF